MIVRDDEAVVELHSLAPAVNGMRFDNRYCLVVIFERGIIVRVRAYLDSAMVARLFEETGPPEPAARLSERRYLICRARSATIPPRKTNRGWLGATEISARGGAMTEPLTGSRKLLSFGPSAWPPGNGC